MDVPYYPVHDFGPLMKGMVIGGLGIFHVFLAQFAIGGGLLMCYLQWLAQTERVPLARALIDRYFKVLVLISFVMGAVTGVGMWFTTIQISPRTIGMMVDQFHWFWAIEWTFFSLEIVSGYCFYRYGSRLADPVRFKLLILYSTAAWFSLFWINGILSWQLTPGAWVESGDVWLGFFNPSFFPSLLFRTVTSMAIAALAACVVINLIPEWTREERALLISKAAHFLAPMLLMPLLGIWYFASIPDDSRSWVTGGSPAMTMFLGVSVGASVLIGAYAAFGLLRRRLYINGATAGLLTALAFAATGGGEFVREGVRKPYTIRETLYANSITPREVEYLRKSGSVSADPYPLRGKTLPDSQLERGAKVYRFQCSVCHTVNGANSVIDLAGNWSLTQQRINIAMLHRTKEFMPPFAGNAEDVEALVQWIRWTHNPDTWSKSEDPEALEQIQRWLTKESE